MQIECTVRTIKELPGKRPGPSPDSQHHYVRVKLWSEHPFSIRLSLNMRIGEAAKLQIGQHLVVTIEPKPS